MNQFEIFTLFVNKALSMKDEDVSIYYQGNIQLIEIYAWQKGVPMSVDTQVKYSYYMDSDVPATREIITAKLEEFQNRLTVS